MEKVYSFDDFWAIAEEQIKNCNGIYYHPCCDVWTTRNSKAKRASHNQFIQWQKLISKLGRSTENKKQAFKAKMVEERMQIPVVLNKLCSAQPKQNLSRIFPFKLQNPTPLPSATQTDLTTQNLTHPSPDQPLHQDTGIFSPYQC
jgi:hypothetical protein